MLHCNWRAGAARPIGSLCKTWLLLRRPVSRARRTRTGAPQTRERYGLWRSRSSGAPLRAAPHPGHMCCVSRLSAGVGFLDVDNAHHVGEQRRVAFLIELEGAAHALVIGLA